MATVKSLCVYCGAARDAGDNTTRSISQYHEDQAYLMGKLMAENSIDLVYGGGRYSMMKAVADGCADNGGHVTGVMPVYLDKVEGFYEKCTELIKTKNMHTRKQKFFDLSDGFVILPGGLGTVEELAEVHKWKQLRMHNKPIIVVNLNGYWDSYLQMVEDVITSNYTEPEARNMLTVVSCVEEVLDAVAKEPEITKKLEADKL